MKSANLGQEIILFSICDLNFAICTEFCLFLKPVIGTVPAHEDGWIGGALGRNLKGRTIWAISVDHYDLLKGKVTPNIQ